jgi:hypothetical protein
MEVVTAGAIAVAYGVAAVGQGARVKPALFVPIVVAAHILLTTLLFRLSPSWTAVLAAGELRTRLGIDGNHRVHGRGVRPARDLHRSTGPALHPRPNRDRARTRHSPPARPTDRPARRPI